MPSERYLGPPMTLGDMRENGVRSLDVWCLGRHVVMAVDHLPDELTIPSIGPRLRWRHAAT